MTKHKTLYCKKGSPGCNIEHSADEMERFAKKQLKTRLREKIEQEIVNGILRCAEPIKGTILEDYVDPNRDLWLDALQFLESEGYSEGLCAETVAGMLQRFTLAYINRNARNDPRLCVNCDGTGLVCGNHPDRPCARYSHRADACMCAPNILCEFCNTKTYLARVNRGKHE